jgi:hypothetical protein
VLAIFSGFCQAVISSGTGSARASDQAYNCDFARMRGGCAFRDE